MVKEHTASNVANADRQTINYFQSCKCRYSKRVLSESGIAIGHGRPIGSYQYKCGHLPNNNSDFSSSIQYEKKSFKKENKKVLLHLEFWELYGNEFKITINVSRKHKFNWPLYKNIQQLNKNWI